MARRSKSLDDEDEGSPAPTRRSQRASTQRDDGHHLNYDLKYHPMDEELQPARALKRKIAHGLETRPIEINSDSNDSDLTEVEVDDDSGAFKGSRGSRKRRSTSSTVSNRSKRRRSDTDGDGQRCSTMKNIEAITKKYNQAWENTINDLSASEQYDYRATQYMNAWEAQATQHADPTHDEDRGLGNIDFDLGRDDDQDDVDQDDQSRKKLEARSPVHSGSEPRRTQSNNSAFQQLLNEEMFQSSREHDSQRPSYLSSQESRSIDESFHNQEEDPAAAPRLHVISSPRHSSRDISLGPAEPKKKPGSTPRSRKKDDVTIYEDSGILETWSQRNLVGRQSYGGDSKENDYIDEDDAPDNGLSLDGASSQPPQRMQQDDRDARDAIRRRYIAGTRVQRPSEVLERVRRPRSSQRRIVDESDEETVHDGREEETASMIRKAAGSEGGNEDEDEQNDDDEESDEDKDEDLDSQSEDGNENGSERHTDVQSVPQHQLLQVKRITGGRRVQDRRYGRVFQQMKKKALRGDPVWPDPVYGIPPSIQVILAGNVS